MILSCEKSITVAVSPETAFALLDDLPRTPEWLKPCVELVNLSPGPNSVGDKLKYTFKQGGTKGVMDGEILVREPNRRLMCRYADKTFQVDVDFHVSPAAEGAQLTHLIEITPKTWLVRMMAPLIRRGLPKQTREAMEGIKRILEAEAR